MNQRLRTSRQPDSCCVGAAYAILVCFGGSIAAGQTVTEFPLPFPDFVTPTHIAAGPDGALWFTDFNGVSIGRITTAGAITRIPLPQGGSASDGIAVGPDGALWFTFWRQGGKIGRISTGGSITEFPIPTKAALPQSIAPGPDGALWFIELFNDSAANSIGRITTAGVVTEFSIPMADSGPSSITAGPDGALWFTESGRNGNKIGRITTAGLINEFPIPTAQSDPSGITAGPDGALWFNEFSGNKIGRITTTGGITEFSLPSAFEAKEIVTGPDGALWFTGWRTQKIGRITTAGAITEFALAPGDRSPAGIAAGPDGNLWFTEFEGDSIGRITTGPCSADTVTLCLGNGRFRVQASWRVPSQGTSGQGTAVSLTGDTGYFWFFSASNVEMIVKVLDACTLNTHKWVFAGGLTNVEVTLTVTDTQAGTVRTYVNPANTAFQPIQDTAAFGTCP